MEILLTNDDGVHSPGISLLASALRREGRHVTTLAPASNKSGVSHAISFLDGPCKITKVQEDTWACEGTPVDCVVLALLGAIPGKEKYVPDLVVSGINKGANLGTDIVYSGTAAAARQASMSGIPALAFSLVEAGEWYWDMAVSFISANFQDFLDFWKADTFINVNIPNRAIPPAGIINAFPSRRHYNDVLEKYYASNGDIYCFTHGNKTGARPEHGSDHEAISSNYASMSAVYIHPALFEEISASDAGTAKKEK
ncbi:MAG: 5'/3'-nucleotidase SurE [Treponema sp.]|nr:5'/3'-nucleotidase SurE [Treponema sp.]